MKIGFSFGRCIRDIVNGDVSIDDVAFLITGTNMEDLTHVEYVVASYADTHGYLRGLDQAQCQEVARALWESDRVLQPRAQKMHRHRIPENAVWVDIFPCVPNQSPAIKECWDKYRMMLHMIESVDNEATDVFRKS